MSYPILATHNAEGLTYKAQQVGDNTVDLFVEDDEGKLVKFNPEFARWSAPVMVTIHSEDNINALIGKLKSYDGGEQHVKPFLSLVEKTTFPFNVGF